MRTMPANLSTVRNHAKSPRALTFLQNTLGRRGGCLATLFRLAIAFLLRGTRDTTRQTLDGQLHSHYLCFGISASKFTHGGRHTLLDTFFRTQTTSRDLNSAGKHQQDTRTTCGHSFWSVLGGTAAKILTFFTRAFAPRWPPKNFPRLWQRTGRWLALLGWEMTARTHSLALPQRAYGAVLFAPDSALDKPL